MFPFSDSVAKNFMDTFGYLTLDLPKNIRYDELISDVNTKAVSKFSTDWNNIVKARRSFIIVPYADCSDVASDIIINHLDAPIKKLLGENYFYLCSDASVFFENGSAWHRDIAMRLPVLKVLIYLDFDAYGNCCDFYILPGSQHVSSSYSGLLQRALAWPDGHGFAGGLCESGLLPDGSDHTDAGYDYQNDTIPSKRVPVTKGRALIFNQAAIHAVKSNIKSGRPRRLVTFAFCANPLDVSERSYIRKTSEGLLSNHELLNEIYLFLAIQGKRMNVFNYGDQLLKYPDYVKSHGVDWNIIKNMSELYCSDYHPEDGGHDTAQMKKMTEFLTQNFMSADSLN